MSEQAMSSTTTGVYGLMAEFADVNNLVAAARRVREEGYVRTDAFSPYPVEGLSEELGLRHTRVPLIVLIGGILGGASGYFMQYYLAVHEYPFNIGGRPAHSWPAFIPVTFELTILTAALCAVLGMFALNGLPMPYHPVFNVPRFALATRDRFFLCIEAADPRFDLERTGALLRSLGSTAVTEVPS
jgi:Protein of unknown function (DUF3341)